MVYGGGGIVPDIVMPAEKFKPIETDLERQQLFFDFAVRYISQHKDLPRDFEVDDKMISDFRDFLKEKNFTYLNQVEVSLQDLEKNINAEKDKDSFAPSSCGIEKGNSEVKGRRF